MKIVCRCEDVTYDEVVEAIKKGYKDIEELKRYLRCSMGTCQGKGCSRLLRQILIEQGVKEVPLSKSRPPIKPLSFFLLEDEDE
jgi:NAD(P)H-nitrite reductase large subunit